MKSLIVSLCLIGLGFSSLPAQTNAPTNATTPVAPAVAPSDSTTTPDNARYEQNPELLNRCQVRLALFNDKPCDIIFIGDSITENWLSVGKDLWMKSYVPRHALNFGLSGDKTQNVLWRLNNMEVQGLKPKVAVVMIGTNNTNNTPHEIADGVKAVLANTQEAFPGVKIILVSITPNERAEDTMTQANSLIRHLADDSTVFYLDLVALMPATTTTGQDRMTNTNWKGIGPDRLHLDADGYQIWTDAMEPLLTKLLAQ